MFLGIKNAELHGEIKYNAQKYWYDQSLIE